MVGPQYITDERMRTERKGTCPQPKHSENTPPKQSSEGLKPGEGGGCFEPSQVIPSPHCSRAHTAPHPTLIPPPPPAPAWALGGAQVERPGSPGPWLRWKVPKAPEVRPTSALPSVHRVSRILCCSRYSRHGPVSPAAACCFSSYTKISSICFSRQGISVFFAGVFSSNRDPGNKVNGVKSRNNVA